MLVKETGKKTYGDILKIQTCQHIDKSAPFPFGDTHKQSSLVGVWGVGRNTAHRSSHASIDIEESGVTKGKLSGKLSIYFRALLPIKVCYNMTTHGFLVIQCQIPVLGNVYDEL